jgi:hypothetical protein
MKVAKALQWVKGTYAINNNRLAIASGVGRATIGKLIRGEHGTITWDLVERLIEGFETFHPGAKGLFLYFLTLPDDYRHDWIELNIPNRVPADPYEKAARLAIKVLLKHNLLRKKETGKLLETLDPDEVESEASLLIQWLSLQMFMTEKEEEFLENQEPDEQSETFEDDLTFSMFEEVEPGQEQSES